MLIAGGVVAVDCAHNGAANAPASRNVATLSRLEGVAAFMARIPTASHEHIDSRISHKAAPGLDLAE